MDIDFINICEKIKTEVSLPCYGSLVNASPIAEGFTVINCNHSLDTENLIQIIASSIKHNKTNIILKPSVECLSYLNTLLKEKNVSIIVSFGDTPLKLPSNYKFLDKDVEVISCIVIISEDYLIRRFFINKLTKNKFTFSNQEYLETQNITCIGLPHLPTLIENNTINLLKSGNNTILFDRTKENIVSNIDFKNPQIVRYDYFDYNRNIQNIDIALYSLQMQNINDVTLLIEGHPDIYDLVECLPHGQRKFTFQPAKPLLLYAVEKLEVDFDIEIFNPAFILTSGFNMRQGVTTSFLKAEIQSYLNTNTSILVMEMFLGDLPLVLELIADSHCPKSVFILTNMFSAEQNIFFLSNYKLHEINWINEIKGKFTSLVILNESTFNNKNLITIKEVLGKNAKV